MVPGADCTVPHEDGNIEKHVDRRLETIVLTFAAKPVIPVEYVAGDKRCEHIIGAYEAHRATNEKLCVVLAISAVYVVSSVWTHSKRDSKHQERFAVHIAMLFRPV